MTRVREPDDDGAETQRDIIQGQIEGCVTGRKKGRGAQKEENKMRTRRKISEQVKMVNNRKTIRGTITMNLISTESQY